LSHLVGSWKLKVHKISLVVGITGSTLNSTAEISARLRSL
jgi:hypothetical protein